jgi:hypothetical protein
MKPNIQMLFPSRRLIAQVYTRNRDNLNGNSGISMCEMKDRRATEENGKVPTAEKINATGKVCWKRMRSGKVEKTLMAITWLLFISQINIV